MFQQAFRLGRDSAPCANSKSGGGATRLFAMALAIGMSTAVVTHLDATDRLIVLGDSLSDNGNAFAATGGAFPPDPPYFQGRFSNGPVWVEYLSDALGLEDSRVMNLAHGGATTGNLNIRVPPLGGMLDQLDAFLSSGVGIGPETLLIIWGGANDLFTIVEIGSLPEEVIPAAVENIAQIILTLVGQGARTIVVPNIPDLGQTPDFIAAGAQDLGTLLSGSFNGALTMALDGIEAATAGVEIVRLDVEELFREIVEDPAAFDFSNVTETCLAADFSSSCNPDDGFLFWDAVHPTTQGHAEISRRALRAIGIPFFIRGDCNGDGVVGDSVHDALALVRHLFLRRRGSICQAACDVNGDGRLWIPDIVGLLRLAFRGDEPVSPFPNCGPGLLETDRRLGCDSGPSCR